eukprot:TRINITY_DN1787_c0_g1_i1.p1 TRINITY_DN1787_c0_g1~~TRINITY_DN1787_c0_g1_i1.p1  ORF type:complete len:441 (+),score=106.36 TRINITY_DN1787_c0_g1_i1:19-1341(+)
MKSLLVVFALLYCAFAAPQLKEVLQTLKASNAVFRAGAAKVDATLPVGAPLAGYNYAPRRVNDWPLPHFGEYTTWMNPSIGVYDPNYVKALVIDTGAKRFCFAAMDFIGADENVMRLAVTIAASMGSQITLENLMVSAAHTHSSGGAVSSDFLWAIAPAIDLLVPDLQRRLANDLATAIVGAERSLEPAKIDVGEGDLPGVTHNRRAHISPYVNQGTVDTHLGVIRVDTLAGAPLAVLWNFAIHGICFDAPNMFFSSDVMGAVNLWNEENIGGISLFMNSDAGDVNPQFGVCCQNLPHYSGGPVIGAAVKKVYDTLKPTTVVDFEYFSQEVDFGPTSLNLTLQRLDNCTHGGELDICSICTMLHCDANIHLPASWIEQTPRFTAIRIDVNNRKNIVVSIPGEALTELGYQIRNDTALMGFDMTLLAGYTNGHLGYFGMCG